MKTFLILVLGIAAGALGVWYYNTNAGKTAVQKAGTQIENATANARSNVQDKLKGINLNSDDIKEELSRTGKVVRKKAQAASDALVDATADARITTAIKAKLVASKELSALSISVNTTGGVVTLSGAVNSAEDVSRAMVLAMETDGVQEVISTLQTGKK